MQNRLLIELPHAHKIEIPAELLAGKTRTQQLDQAAESTS